MATAVTQAKASACAALAKSYGMRAGFDWLGLLKQLLAMFGVCGVSATDAHDHITDPDWLDEFAMMRTAIRFSRNRDEARAAVAVVKRVGEGQTQEETAAMFAEAPH